MRNIGDYVVYKRDVCLIKNIYKNEFNNLECYELNPIDDDSLKITIPITNELIRDIISKDAANTLISNIKDINILDIPDKQLEAQYKKLLSSNRIEDLIPIIKTTYLKNKGREDNNKKASEKDKFYFDLAEKLLYNELSLSLNKSIDEVKNIIFAACN